MPTLITYPEGRPHHPEDRVASFLEGAGIATLAVGWVALVASLFV